MGGACALLLAFTLTATLAPVGPARADTLAVPASADAFVLSTSPSANRGLVGSLRIRGDRKVAYVRFDVPPLPEGASVLSATLRVSAKTGTGGCAVEVLRAASDDWGEATITWANQPGPTGEPLASVTWSAPGPQAFDVTGAVGGSGPVSFLLRHAPGCAGSADVVLKSRESAKPAQRPRLDVTTTSSGAPPPPAACANGLDDDGDGLIDHPADPGCFGPEDGTEEDPPPPPEGARVVAAAGDIVCDPGSFAYGGADPTLCQHRATAALLAEAEAVLPLGDLQYSDGTLEKFTTAYDPTWGAAADRTFPAVGNHEYNDPTGGASGYFTYWGSKGRPTGGAGAGYYSFDLGSWHLIALNSNCSIVPCAEGSPQNDFLEQDLAATTQPCILAYWHHPLFNSGAHHGSATPAGARAFWEDLYAAGADIVLNGHEHNYQRYGKQDPTGVATPDGIREFVVGTGGNSHYEMLEAKDPNYEFGDATRFGVLILSLGPGSYVWRFVDVTGTVIDSGGPVPCN
ncbi:MAG TPA: DNRLRE domain-containing protein [Actinomycetota bacterium]|nr:DNRLRE domain-containing protein [Actinomycetota bacterium]